VFGNLIHQTGTTPNNYLFAGEQFDPDLNLYYNRARYLSTNTGRFWSMDDVDGKDERPLSLHKFLYAEDDPVNSVDPGGNEIDELIGSLGVFDTLQSISMFQVTPFLNHAKVEVHFDFLASVFFRKYHRAYLVVSGPGGPPTIFRGGPSQSGCGAGAAIKDGFGARPSDDLGCGYLTKYGSGMAYAPVGPTIREDQTITLRPSPFRTSRSRTIKLSPVSQLPRSVSRISTCRINR
jgi:RHS repeat-associated protein